MKGLYKYTCKCSNKAIYIGQTARSFEHRWKEHGSAINNETWSHSGITQHHQNFPQHFDKENFKIVTKMQGKKKRRLAYDIKIREALEFRHHSSGPGKGLNEDIGAYIRTDIWDPVLNHIGNNWSKLWVLPGEGATLHWVLLLHPLLSYWVRILFVSFFFPFHYVFPQ